MPPLDRYALAAWNAKNLRAREEYATSPLTNRAVRGPCIRPRCTRTAHTLRGVCRTCLAEENA